MKTTAIILAAGKGKRMGLDIPKQYICIGNKPLLYYTIKAFEESPVTNIVLVVSQEDKEHAAHDFLTQYSFAKITSIIAGGAERYDSVYYGLKQASDADYVLIHDGARPFVTVDIISRAMEAAKLKGACAVGMPVKDTIKIVNQDNCVESTPERSKVWTVQTPQAFEYNIIWKAYDEMYQRNNKKGITDDAMVVESILGKQVTMVEGSYENLKITTPEDLLIAEMLLKKA